ncbi:MAG: T9SS type A sorting domain-containing protein, partial [Bacteroidota bacterium]
SDPDYVSAIDLYTIQGKKMLHIPFVAEEYKNCYIIDLKTLHKGVYSLIVSIKNGNTYTKRVILE